MKAVIDTNVLISGIFWKGPPRKILNAWERRSFTWVVSPSILGEYERVLAELGAKFPEIGYGRILELIAIHAELVNEVRFTRPVCKDKDDDKFLGAALAGGASHVVSGDRILLDCDGFRGLKVLQPRAFLQLF